jgi:hypothetical protein
MVKYYHFTGKVSIGERRENLKREILKGEGVWGNYEL